MYDREKGYMAFLGFVVILGTFYLGYVLLTKTIPQGNKDILNVALGLLFGLSGTVVGYYFGSSKGSSDKSNFMAKHIHKELDKKNEEDEVSDS